MKEKLLKAVAILAGCVVGLMIIACSIYTFLFYPRTAETFEINTPNPTQKILIATQSTEFKNDFTKNLCDSLVKNSAYIRGIDISKLSEINEDNWDRIIICNSFIISLNKDANKFIKRVKTPEKIMMFVTSGGADWLPRPELNVDAITSASRIEYKNGLIHLVTDWVEKDVYNQWHPNDYLQALLYFPGVNVNTACKVIEQDIEKYQDRYPNLARIINRVGYQFIRLDDIDSALKVFHLNIKLYPDVWNVYDSYGEALYYNGNRDLAIRNYKKALDLNPNSKSAGKMFKKLSKM